MMNDDFKNKNGTESLNSPYSHLSSTFARKDLKEEDNQYTLSDAEPLIKKLKSKLRESQTGARLLDVAESRGLKIHLIKSKKLQSAATPKMELFLAAEEKQTEPYMIQILEFGGALREIEQLLLGYRIPDDGADPLERANIAHTKFLDKIVYMCKIGLDLEVLYSDDVKKAIDAFGYEDIYNAQKQALGEDVVRDIYLEAQKSEVAD
ncbi:MAG: hypothetical protein H6855_04505 [Rhodospirillales bacterium]|nr:hypothetical protein [Rhodospirillales bacterium]MCB9973167.1 hypothetical protein [Rhodospirillales bacterium]